MDWIKLFFIRNLDICRDVQLVIYNLFIHEIIRADLFRIASHHLIHQTRFIYSASINNIERIVKNIFDEILKRDFLDKYIIIFYDKNENPLDRYYFMNLIKQKLNYYVIKHYDNENELYVCHS